MSKTKNNADPPKEDVIDTWNSKTIDVKLQRLLKEKLELQIESMSVDETTHDPYILEEEFGSLFTKFLMGQSYDISDMMACAETIIKKNKAPALNTLRVVISTENLQTFLNNHNDGSTAPLFVIFEEEPKLWVTFAIVKTDLPQADPKEAKKQLWTILYKHPGQYPMGEYLEKFLKEQNSNLEVFYNDHKGFLGSGVSTCEVAYDYSGLLTLRNLEVIKSLVDNNTVTKHDLDNSHFADIKSLKPLLRQKIRFHAQNLYAIPKFDEKFKKLQASLPITFNSNIHKFFDNINSNHDYHNSRKSYLNNDVLRNVETSMNREFYKEITSFATMSKLISCCVQTQEEEEYLNGIYDAFHKLLNLSKDTMKRVFRNKSEVPLCKPKVEAAELCQSNLIVPGNFIAAENFKTLYQTLVRNVKDSYKKVTLAKGCEEIRKWGITTRKEQFKVNGKDYFKNLAHIKRGFILSTGNVFCHELMDLYLLMILQQKGNSIKMIQLKNKRLKTYLIALLAVVKVLMGHKVDIITSSEAHAKEAVNLTRKLFNIFGISVDHNCSKELVKYNRICYFNDVVYGPLKNFQFDHLKQEVEGIPVRRRREYQCLLIDEAEDVTVKKDQNFANITESFPGINRLIYIYINIWENLQKVEETYTLEVNNRVEGKLCEITSRHKSQGVTDETGQIEYEKFLEAVLEKQIELFETDVSQRQPQTIDVIPSHLKVYAEDKVKKWIKSAIYARFNCVENRDYRIVNDRIVPIDLSTGMSLKDAEWTDGLQQFLQLKHGLRVTAEKVKSCFISNIQLIENYNKDEVFCIAASFGEKEGKNLLQKIHNNYAVFMELPDSQGETTFDFQFEGKICEDSSWYAKIVAEAVEHLKTRNAVVIVCKTLEDAECLTEGFQFLKEMNIDCNVRRYFEEDHIEGFGQVDCGDVIITTNMVGVNVGFQMSPNLIANNKINLIVGFLPSTRMEEDRLLAVVHDYGKKVKMIIRQSEVFHFKLSKITFKQAISKRDQEEKARLEALEEITLKEIKFKDEMMNVFINQYRGYRLLSSADVGKSFVLRDLKECWALWLDRKDYSAETGGHLIAADEFQKFLDDMNFGLNINILNNMGGAHFKNPYYAILRAQQEIDDRSFQEASARLDNLVKSKADFGSLAALHLKKFQLKVESKNYILNRIAESIDDKISVNKEDSLVDSLYQENIDEVNLLKASDVAILRELAYIRSNVLARYSINDNVENVILNYKGANSPFLKQMLSRRACLIGLKKMIDYLLKDIENQQSRSKLLIMKFKVPRYFTQNKQINGIILEEEMDELLDEGLHVFYLLESVRTIPSEIAENTMRLFRIARNLVKVAIFFPDYALSSVVLAVDGVCASTLSILTDFHKHLEAPLVTSKILSTIPTDRVYGDEFLTTKLIKDAIKAGQQIASLSLSETAVGKDITADLLDLSRKVKNSEEKLIADKKNLFNLTLRQVGFQVVTKNLQVLTQPVLKIFFGKFTPWLLDQVYDHVRKALINEREVKKALRYSLEDEETVLQKISDYVQASYELVDLSVAMAKKFKKLYTDWLTFTGVCDIYKRPNTDEEELLKFSSGLKNFIKESIKYNRYANRKDWDDVTGKVQKVVTTAVSKMTLSTIFSTFFFNDGPQALKAFESGTDPTKKTLENYALAALNLHFMEKIGKTGIANDRARLLLLRERVQDV